MQSKYVGIPRVTCMLRKCFFANCLSVCDVDTVNVKERVNCADSLPWLQSSNI